MTATRFMYASWDMCYVISTSGYRPPSSIPHKSARRAMFFVVSRVARPRKNGYSLSVFVAIVYASWDRRYIIPASGCRPPYLIYDTLRHSDIGQYSYLILRIFRPRKHGLTVGLYKLNYVYNYIISAAILYFWLPVTSGSVSDSTIEKFDPQNMGNYVFIMLDSWVTRGCDFAPLPLVTL